MSDGICKIPECAATPLTKTRGWCRNHDRRWRLYGDPLGGQATPGIAREYFYTTLYTVTSDCKVWPYNRVPNGYGVLQIAGQQYAVHRLACLAWNGPPPPNRQMATHMPVLCHNRACHNGAHLSWGNAPSQWVDQVHDGTALLGVKNHAAKLTPELVREIRCRYASGGIRQKDLAREYGLRQPAISSLLRRETWQHVE